MTSLFPVSSYPLAHRKAPFRLLPRYARRLHLLRTVPYATDEPDPGPRRSEPDGPGPGRRQTDGQHIEAAVRAGQIAIEVDAGPATTTVYIDGELDLVTKPFFAERLALVLRNNPRRLVLDMERTSFMDCGCAQVIAATTRSLPADACLVIRRPGPGIRRVLELTGTDACCEIEP